MGEPVSSRLEIQSSPAGRDWISSRELTDETKKIAKIYLPPKIPSNFFFTVDSFGNAPKKCGPIYLPPPKICRSIVGGGVNLANLPPPPGNISQIFFGRILERINRKKKLDGIFGGEVDFRKFYGLVCQVSTRNPVSPCRARLDFESRPDRLAQKISSNLPPPPKIRIKITFLYYKITF